MRKIFGVADIEKLGMSRGLNKKLESKGILPKASISVDGPPKPSEYSRGDLYLRAVFKHLVNSGFSWEAAKYRLWGRGPKKSWFNCTAEKITSRYLCFPRYDYIPPGKSYSVVVPFDEFERLDYIFSFDDLEFDDLVVANWRNIRAEVDEILDR